MSEEVKRQQFKQFEEKILAVAQAAGFPELGEKDFIGEAFFQQAIVWYFTEQRSRIIRFLNVTGFYRRCEPPMFRIWAKAFVYDPYGDKYATKAIFDQECATVDQFSTDSLIESFRSAKEWITDLSEEDIPSEDTSF